MSADPDEVDVLILRRVLGDAGVQHVARCLQVAEKETARREGIEPPKSVRGARDLLLAASISARRAEVETEVGGRSEVPDSAPAPPLVMTEWVTTKEVADMLKCTDRNVRDLCKRGAFESARRRGNLWQVDRDEVVDRAATVRAR